MEQRTKDTVNAILNHEKFSDFLFYLKCRWKDEREFEDFAEYEKAMKKNIPESRPEFIKGTKRPFGMQVKLDGYKFLIFIKNKGSYEVTAARVIA